MYTKGTPCIDAYKYTYTRCFLSLSLCHAHVYANPSPVSCVFSFLIFDHKRYRRSDTKSYAQK